LAILSAIRPLVGPALASEKGKIGGYPSQKEQAHGGFKHVPIGKADDRLALSEHLSQEVFTENPGKKVEVPETGALDDPTKRGPVEIGQMNGIEDSPPARNPETDQAPFQGESDPVQAGNRDLKNSPGKKNPPHLLERRKRIEEVLEGVRAVDDVDRFPQMLVKFSEGLEHGDSPPLDALPKIAVQLDPEGEAPLPSPEIQKLSVTTPDIDQPLPCKIASPYKTTEPADFTLEHEGVIPQRREEILGKAGNIFAIPLLAVDLKPQTAGIALPQIE
jgi:hypothetical protein